MPDRREILQRIYSEIQEIPTLPAVVPRLLELFERKNTTAREIAELISEDPALTANVLKVANSAYYGFPGKIASIEHAVMLLGFNMVRALTLSVGVIKSLSRETSSFSEEDLWIHSIRVATSMQELSEKYNKVTEERGYVFIIGLLHDIGKIVFDQLFPKEYKELLESSQEAGTGNAAWLEREHFGIDHAEAGAELLKRWHFPEIIWKPIGAHHEGSLPEDVDPALISLLRVSDTVSLNLFNPEELCPEECKEELEVLQMGEEVLSSTADYLKSSEERIRAFYDALH